MAPFVPCVFSHCLLLSDCAYLRHFRNKRKDCWLLAGVSGSEAFRCSSAYDLCFDLGEKKFYVNSVWKVGDLGGDDMQKRLLRSQKLANFDRILVNEVGFRGYLMNRSGWNSTRNTRASSRYSSKSRPIFA